MKIRTYPSGERRISVRPPKQALEQAYAEFGTHKAMAAAFGVSRDTVQRWLDGYGMQVVSRPEILLARSVRERLGSLEDCIRVSQWIMDEGSISVAYFRRDDHTALLVCGSMNDYEVLSRISATLGAPITSSKSPKATILPLGALRVSSSKAYALLVQVESLLLGLKKREARSALQFFPPSGIVRGRHTTDEFLIPVWKEFALETLTEWNSRRRIKIGQEEIEARARSWVEGRIRRARRFVDVQRGTFGSLASPGDYAQGY